VRVDQLEPRLILGTLHLRELDASEIASVLHAFFERGGRVLDTATLYGGLPLLTRVGAWLRSTGAPARTWLKVGYFDRLTDYRDDRAFAAAASAAREALGPSTSAVLVHEADWRLWWDDARPDERVRVDGLRAALGDLPVGYSGNNAAPLHQVVRAAPPTGPVLVAKQYDLLWNTAEPLVRWAETSSSPLALGAPWHQGWLWRLEALAAERPELASATAALRDLAQELGTSPAALALPFLARSSPKAHVAFGARTPEEVHAAFDAFGEPLSEASFVRVAALRRPLPPMGPFLQDLPKLDE
jgi:aryl-alcohol dehydrogenase-like predicted oxidoreductase